MSQDAVKWMALLNELKHSFDKQNALVVLLNKNQVAEDIVMGWVGVELYEFIPGVVLENPEWRIDAKIDWLWNWVDMRKATSHAKQSTNASIMVVIDSINWLINNGIIWPDGTVAAWAGIWREARSQCLMAGQLKVIHSADKLKSEAGLVKLQLDAEQLIVNKKLDAKGKP